MFIRALASKACLDEQNLGQIKNATEKITDLTPILGIFRQGK